MPDNTKEISAYTSFSSSSLGISVFNLIVAIFIKYLSAGLYFKSNKGVTSYAIISMHHLLLLSSLSRVFYEADPTAFFSTRILSEMGLALAISIHETVQIKRWKILIGQWKKVKNIKYLMIFLSLYIWTSCLLRIISILLNLDQLARLNSSTQAVRSLDKISLFLFYASMGLLDLIISLSSWKLIADMKIRTKSFQAIDKLRRLRKIVQYILDFQIFFLLLALLIGLPSSGSSESETRVFISISHMFIYLAAYVAFLYSVNFTDMMRYNLSNNSN